MKGHLRNVHGGWQRVRGVLLCWWVAAIAAIAAMAAPAFDTTTPASFFTNVANLVLLDQTGNWQAQNFAGYTNSFGAAITNAFGATNIPVWVNGSFVYSSSVQRLLQVSANVYEAMNTNTYPSVYRPTFYFDPVCSNVYISGYQLVASVSGASDPVLSSPVDVAAIVSGDATNLSDVNVYGVPWIIGARKGFPSFNALNMINEVQVGRYIQVSRASTNNFNPANYSTNVLFLMSVNNCVNVSLWNSYDGAYAGAQGIGPVSICMQDTMRTIWTNSDGASESSLHFFDYFQPNVSAWPGSQWGFFGTNACPASFYVASWTNAVVPLSILQYPSGQLAPIGGIAPTNYFPATTYNYPFPQFGYATTNYFQAFILDGSNVVDYVQFSGPNQTRDLTAELADPNFAGGNIKYMWSTNGYPANNSSGSPPSGEVNQILLSRGLYPASSSPPGGTWSQAPIPGGPSDFSAAAQQAFFGGFFTPSWTYNGVRYVNTQFSVLAPYTPTRTMVDYTLWEANDPQVHYLGNDLNVSESSNDGLVNSDYMPPAFDLPDYDLEGFGARYQPWGAVRQMADVYGVDISPYNLAYRDPEVVGSDDWTFPTNQTWNPNWLGAVHRGTPWQTVYLKSTNILSLSNFVESGYAASGANGLPTWEAWAGNTNPVDAARTAPVNDWHLAAFLATILNTNSRANFFSANNPDPGAWSVELNGLFAVTNSFPEAGEVLSSNLPVVASVAAAIESTRASQPGQEFPEVGAVIATPQLSVASPLLNTTGVNPPVSDAAYEALPSQLLGNLGLVPIGTPSLANGQYTMQFSAEAGRLYVLQSSPDLAHWTNLSTNAPVNGLLNLTLASPPLGPREYYRCWLLQ